MSDEILRKEVFVSINILTTSSIYFQLFIKNKSIF